MPVKVPQGVDLTVKPDEPEVVVTAEQQESGWDDEDLAIHEGATDINEQNDVVVDEALDSDECEGSEAPDVRGW